MANEDSEASIITLRAENAALRQQCEQLQTESSRLGLFEVLAENALDGIIVSDLSGAAIYANRAALQLMGVSTLEECAVKMRVLLGPELVAEQIASLQQRGSWEGTYWATRGDGSAWRVLSSVFVLTNSSGEPLAYAALARDVTEAYHAEQERIALQEQVIQGQEGLLRELSTPLIPIAAGVVIMPLIGSIDSRRVNQILEVLLDGIVNYQADYAILDVTGVSVIDTQIAVSIMRIAQAAKLLGAQVALTGINSSTAQSLVLLGADLSSLQIYSNLQTGIASVLETIS